MILLRSLLLFTLFAQLASAESVRVIKVVDGDTLRVFYDGQSELLRLIGVDTPEKYQSERADKEMQKSGHSRKEVFDLGERASRFTESKVQKGDKIEILFDAEKRDRYGRLLGYVYLSDGTMLNEELLRQGYAHIFTVPPNVRHKDDFITAHNVGRTLGRGLWSFDSFKDEERPTQNRKPWEIFLNKRYW